MSQDFASSLSVPGVVSPSLLLDFQPKIFLGIWTFMSDLSCIVCRIPATKRCSICKSASYCSKEHQKQDWHAHKDYCRKVKKAGANTFDAILFPAAESKPRIVKIPYEFINGMDEYDLSYHKPDLSFWFKHPNAAIKRYYIDQLGFDGSALDPPMCFFFDDNFSMNKLPINRCIVDVTGGKAGHEWCGNVMGLRLREKGNYDLLASGNMEEDLGVFTEYFQKYGSE